MPTSERPLMPRSARACTPLRRPRRKRRMRRCSERAGHGLLQLVGGIQREQPAWQDLRSQGAASTALE